MTKDHIAGIEGDGIDREDFPEGNRVLEAVGHRYNIDFFWRHYDWRCDTNPKTLRLMPEDGTIVLQDFDEFKAMRDINTAFETVLADLTMHALNLGRTMSTRDVGEAIAHKVSVVPESE
jgi:isocitrate/isopropylmalate dehydrogenase